MCTHRKLGCSRCDKTGEILGIKSIQLILSLHQLLGEADAEKAASWMKQRLSKKEVLLKFCHLSLRGKAI